MTTIPQTYPLWLAELSGLDIRLGRVVAWTAPAPGTPIVAWDVDGQWTETGQPDGRIFLGETRQDAQSAAELGLWRTCKDHVAAMVQVDGGHWRCPRAGCLATVSS